MGRNRQHRAGMKIILLIIVGLGLCMPICNLAEHHGSGAAHPFVCAIDMPQVFQLLILMDALFLVFFSGIVFPQAPAFPLLKPPRFVPFQLTGR